MTVVPDVAAGQGLEKVDVLRLLWLMRIRHELKVVCLCAIVAVPVWAGVTLAAESMMSRSSSAFWTLDSKIGPGFLVIFGVLVAALACLFGMRLLGKAGCTAAWLVPALGKAPKLDPVESDSEVVQLYGRLRRRHLVSGVSVMLLVLCGFVAVVTAWNLWPAWEANHGRGGPVVTIGKTATITGYTVGSHGHRDYFLGTPYGPAIAEDYQPHAGQEWTVLPSDTGNGKAYLVGGYDYVLIGGLLLASIAVGAVIGVRIVAAVRAGRAARAATRAEHPAQQSVAGAPPQVSVAGKLADTVAYLSSGNTVTLRIAGRRPRTVALTLRPTVSAVPRHGLPDAGGSR